MAEPQAASKIGAVASVHARGALAVVCSHVTVLQPSSLRCFVGC